MQTNVLPHLHDIAAGWRVSHVTPPPDDLPRGPALRPLVSFSTEHFAPTRQLDAWNAQFGSVIEIVEPVSQCLGYAARITTWKLGPFALSRLAVQAARARRTQMQIKHDSLDHWVVSLARQSTQSVCAAGRRATVPIGIPFIVSLADAFEGECSDLDWLCLFIPRETFPELAPMIDRCRNLPLTGGMGLLLGQYLVSLETQLPSMTENELPRLVAATRAMVAACVAPSTQTIGTAAPQLECARRERVRQVIRRNLRSPTLTPTRLCRLVGMSRSQLYRLFEPAGGVARYIQADRLREAHRALADPANLRDIREDLGFFDPSAFSRAFRREFACRPSEVRAAALLGTASAPLRRTAAGTAATDFASVLRLLQ